MFKLLSKSFLMLSVFLATSMFPLVSQSTGDSFDYDIDDGEEEVSNIVAKDIYIFKLSLRVPQVLNNSTSKGVRKIQRQIITGNLNVLWHEDGSCSFETEGLYNKNFKIGGKNVTYEGYAGDAIVYPRFNYIGSNLTEKFKTPCLYLSLVLEPSYALESVSEDNSFYLVLSGFGTSLLKNGTRIATKIRGNASGSQGCGCMDYGHKSPTRKACIYGVSDDVSDVVATYGTWTMKWKKRVVLE